MKHLTAQPAFSLSITFPITSQASRDKIATVHYVYTVISKATSITITGQQLAKLKMTCYAVIHF